ncbi:MAG TPA: class I mannose-6-phosphate isomerase [Clostridiales bacterium]|nr:class I mannose-6-phosphate isomerase [Clostridiales bacterium]
MFYPLKFVPVYKDYIWGGRNLEKLGKKLPEGKVAESWEVSCHPDGESIISNGLFKGKSLTDYVNEFNYKVIGTGLSWKPGDRFPLLIKLIDANDRLSVQVHPDDEYASLHEEDKNGKNEMWYVISAKPGAKLVYGLKTGTTREKLENAVRNNSIEEHLNYIQVAAGDALNIPAGLVHAIGSGILLAEVQQNSNNTYRVYDYERVDINGNKRPLHIEKALEVISYDEEASCNDDVSNINTFNNKKMVENYQPENSITHLVSSKYFAVDLIDISSEGEIEEIADGSRFYIYLFIKGDGVISYSNNGDSSHKNNGDSSRTGSQKCTQSTGCFFNKIDVKMGESVFIPASMGNYKISGNIKCIKAYIPLCHMKL